MTQRLTRRAFGKSAASAAALVALGARSHVRAANIRTLKFIPQSDLRVLDPIWTTAYITRNHGYMVFDTLFALDDRFKPHPQMVGDFSVSDDRLTYRFTLRDGLKFHDGEPVRGIDCTASLERWMKRDALGQTLAASIAEMVGGGGTDFTIHLKEPFPLLIEAIAKVSSLAPFIMPERLARTDAYQQVTEMVGSGPFKFVKSEFEPGHKVVYVKNADYAPRSEPPNWASGGKVVKVDRVEWYVVPDATTKMAAIRAGEFDWWENPPADFWPVLAGDPNIALERLDPLGGMGCLRFNFLHPPFDNIKMRQAVLMAASQADFMTAFVGEEKNWKLCPSYFTCGTPMESTAGSEALSGPRDLDKAKKLIAEAGYKGEKILLLDGVDQPLIHAQALVAADIMRKVGLNIDVAASDWGTVVTRRAVKKLPAEGGWNMFPTGWVGADLLDPSTNVMLRTNGESAWFGWPKDDRIEALRTEWLKADGLVARKELAAKLQQRAFEFVPYVPTGQYLTRTALRKNVKGYISAPAIFMWNIEKT